jgi:hypothetical protein
MFSYHLIITSIIHHSFIKVVIFLYQNYLIIISTHYFFIKFILLKFISHLYIHHVKTIDDHQYLYLILINHSIVLKTLIHFMISPYHILISLSLINVNTLYLTQSSHIYLMLIKILTYVSHSSLQFLTYTHLLFYLFLNIFTPLISHFLILINLLYFNYLLY